MNRRNNNRNKYEIITDNKAGMLIQKEYYHQDGLPKLNDLPEILGNFYLNMQTLSNELYSVQSQKCIRASLNRHFKQTRSIDIIQDLWFIEANEIFNGVKVLAKKSGKGVRKSTKMIIEDDMKRLGDYFLQDFNPGKPVNVKKLQQCVMFYVMYFFCRRGWENLHFMTLDWYKVKTDSNRKKYVEQVHHETDKNHNADDPNPSNEAKMYENPGKN